MAEPKVLLDTNFDPETFDLHDLCRELEIDLDLLGLSLTLPFNVNLSLTHDRIPNPGDVTGRLLAELNSTLAPLTPVFDLLDFVLVIVDVLDAVSSLNPYTILQALKKLLPKVPKLKALLPIVSIPYTIKSVLRVLIVALIGIRADIRAILDEQTRIDLTAQRATKLGALDLTAAVSCMKADLDARITLTRNNAAPLNRLILTLNILCKLAKLPAIPPVTIGPDMAAALGPLTAAIEALRAAEKAIPLPPTELSLV